MSRTRMEVDALTNVIYDQIVQERIKLSKAQDVKDKIEAKLESSGLNNIIEEYEALRKRQIVLAKLFNKKLGLPIETYVPVSKGNAHMEIQKQVLGFRMLKKDDIADQIIISGDAGAEILQKKILKMFT